MAEGGCLSLRRQFESFFVPKTLVVGGLEEEISKKSNKKLKKIFSNFVEIKKIFKNF